MVKLCGVFGCDSVTMILAPDDEVVDFVLHICHYFDSLGMLGCCSVGSRGVRDFAGPEQGPHVALLPAPVAATGLPQRQADPLVGASLHFATTRLNGSFVPSRIVSDANQDHTLHVLNKWIPSVRNSYRSVFQRLVPSDDQGGPLQLQWTPERFRHVMELKEEALDKARSLSVDYIWVTKPISFNSDEI